MGVYGTTIITGATPVVNGTSGRILYNNSSAVGEATVTGTLGSVVLSESPTIVTPAITTTATLTRTSIGSTSADGLVLTNTTAAAAGAQQYSPRLRLTGQGWKTNATAASQASDWIIEVQPVQGTSAPTANLVSSVQINNGGYSAVCTLTSGGHLRLPSNQTSAASIGPVDSTNTGITFASGGGNPEVYIYAGGTAYFSAKASQANLSTPICITTNLGNPGPNGATLAADAADVLALRRSTNAQTFRVYNTYTNSSNGEWLSMSWSTVSNNMYIRTEKNGTGTARVMHLAHSGNSAAISIGTTVNAAGALSLIGNNLGTATASTGILDISPSGATATSGTLVIASVRPTVTPTSTSTLTFIPFQISPTINYSNATPGAGSYEALKIAVTETALPTGTNYLIRASAGAAGTTDKFTVSNGGNVVAAGTLQIADTKILKSTTSFSDGAGANTATLTNAPAATNPTKWIPIDDNGTTRYIPAW